MKGAWRASAGAHSGRLALPLSFSGVAGVHVIGAGALMLTGFCTVTSGGGGCACSGAEGRGAGHLYAGPSDAQDGGGRGFAAARRSGADAGAAGVIGECDVYDHCGSGGDQRSFTACRRACGRANAGGRARGPQPLEFQFRDAAAFDGCSVGAAGAAETFVGPPLSVIPATCRPRAGCVVEAVLCSGARGDGDFGLDSHCDGGGAVRRVDFHAGYGECQFSGYGCGGGRLTPGACTGLVVALLSDGSLDASARAGCGETSTGPSSQGHRRDGPWRCGACGGVAENWLFRLDNAQSTVRLCLDALDGHLGEDLVDVVCLSPFMCVKYNVATSGHPLCLSEAVCRRTRESRFPNAAAQPAGDASRMTRGCWLALMGVRAAARTTGGASWCLELDVHGSRLAASALEP